MLTNYDAKAIAGVLGLAFLRRSKASHAPIPESEAATRSKPRPGVLDQDFVIRVDDATSSPSEFENHRLLPPTPVLIEKAVERGLPRKALRHVAEWLAGGDQARVSILEWGVVPKTTLERRLTQLSPKESERTERVARLAVHARRALGTEAEAREFMTTPHPELDGRSPLDAARTDLGTRRTEQILNALEYGLAL